MRKKIMILPLLAGMAVWADYTMVYEMHDPEEPQDVVTSTFRYKDAEHGRVDMKMQDGEAASSMLVLGKKAYMISYEDGEANVMDMDEMMKMASMFGGGMPEETEKAAEETLDKATIRKTGKYKTVGGIKGEIWKVAVNEEGQKKTYEMVMTDDRDYLKAVEAYGALMKRMVAGGGEKMETEMFSMVHEGHAPIEIDGNRMRLKSFSEDDVDAKVFELPKGSEVKKSPFGSMFSSEGKKGTSEKAGGIADACYTKLCCGQVQGDAEVLSSMVAPSAEGYTLEGSAKCDALGLGALFGVNSVEGAIYKQGQKAVTVTLDLDAKNKGTVMQTREAEKHGGPQATGYKSGLIGEHTYHYAVLMPMNVQQLDILLDSKTIISLSHPVAQGKVPLVKFAKTAIDFDAFTPKKTKEAATEKSASQHDAAEAKTSEGSNTDAINKGVDKAVDMFKSIF